MKIAIVYDRVNKFGGAEQVLLALHELFPDAPLYTSVYDPQHTAWLHGWTVHTSFLQHIPFARRHHEWFGWLMPAAFESLNLSGFDVVISVTSEAAKGIITGPDQIHICYCLTPTRYLWSHTQEYAHGMFSGLKQFVFSWIRHWDFVAASRPDHFIAISNHVAKRIEKYYRRDISAVIYPPVALPLQEESNTSVRDYFLVVSRLVPYKKIDVAISACMSANKRLVIVGTGSDEKRLRTIAAGNPLITFVGFVSQEELSSYYGHAIALICPQEEDFGIVSLEAQSYATPVISHAYSGMVETIVDGETGIIFSDDLVSALELAQEKEWDRSTIRSHATEFSKAIFHHHWKKVIASYSVE